MIVAIFIINRGRDRVVGIVIIKNIIEALDRFGSSRCVSRYFTAVAAMIKRIDFAK